MDCKNRDAPLTVAGLAVSLGVDRKTIINYKKREKFFPIIKIALDFINQDHEERLSSGKSVSPAGTIFIMKNNFNYVEKMDYDMSGHISIGEVLKKTLTGDSKNAIEGEIIEKKEEKEEKKQLSNNGRDFFENPL